MLQFSYQNSPATRLPGEYKPNAAMPSHRIKDIGRDHLLGQEALQEGLPVPERTGDPTPAIVRHLRQQTLAWREGCGGGEIYWGNRTSVAPGEGCPELQPRVHLSPRWALLIPEIIKALLSLEPNTSLLCAAKKQLHSPDSSRLQGGGDIHWE